MARTMPLRYDRLATVGLALLLTLGVASTAHAEPRLVAGIPEQTRIIWRSEAAMRQGQALWPYRNEGTVALQIMQHVACLAPGQTPVAVTQGGRHVSHVVVPLGRLQGCTGVIVNGDLAPR